MLKLMKLMLMNQGAEAIGYPGVIHGLFPKGGFDLVHYFSSSCNSRLSKSLREMPESLPPQPHKVVHDALENRLKMILPYKKTWPQAITSMSLPQNIPTSLANLLTLVDDVCYYAGDRSVDMNWYSRRIALAGIYKTTELYMLQDSSNDNKETWQFLKRRIEDAAQIEKVVSKTTDTAYVSEAANAVFATARNILGLSWKR